MKKFKIGLVFTVFAAIIIPVFSISYTMADEVSYIYEDFEDNTLSSYNGGSGLSASVKPTSGGSQNIVSIDNKKLKIAVDYIADASSHDSFVQMSQPMSVDGDMVASVDIYVPDSTKGSFVLNAIAGEYIPAAIIKDGTIKYPDNSTETYTDGETINLLIHINSQKNRLRIYKNDVLKFGSDNVQNYYPDVNLSSVRIRYSASVIQSDTSYYESYIDNILIKKGLAHLGRIGEPISIAENFESYPVTSFEGGGSFQSSVKQSTGGSQNIVSKDTQALCIAVKYINGVSAHDSFLQMKNPIHVDGNFISSVDVNIPDSSSGSFSVEMICSASFWPVTVANDKISYPGGIEDTYTNGEKVTLSIMVNSQTNHFRIYKNGVLRFETDNIKSYYPGCNLSNIRLRYVSNVVREEGKSFEAFVDNIYIASGVNENDLYLGQDNIKRQYTDNKTDVYKLRDGSYVYSAILGYNGTSQKNVSFLLARYSAYPDKNGRYLSDISKSDIVINPGFNNVDITFNIEDFNNDDSLEIYFMPEGDYNMIFQRISNAEFTKMTNPSGDTMINMLSDTHPRVWINNNKISEIKNLIQIDANMNSWYQSIKAQATQLLTKPLPVYEDDDPQRLVCSQTVVAAVPLLSFVYLMDNEEEYAFRAYEYMMEVCEFPDWAPYHFLDTSNITIAVSIGYDWLYNYFTAKKIDTSYFEDKIASMGLSMGKDAYLKKLYTGNHWWVEASTNWNVCCNSGMTVAALAIGKVVVHSELCSFVLEQALASLERMLPRFAPDGAWFEGPSYWGSTTSPLSSMVDALETALGTDYGIMSFDGLSNTAYYPIMNTGSKITFNLHDASESAVSAPQYWFFAKNYNDKNLAGYRCWQINELGYEPSYKDLLWYDASLIEDDFDNHIKKDAYFRDIEIAVFRNSYKGDNINFFGIHGGSNSVEHGQLDAGTFVYEALGERWAIDLGGEMYNMHNYWVMDDIEKSRWGYYRSRAEGHNTIVINPGLLADQDINCISVMEEFTSSDSNCSAKVNIGSAYKKYVSSAVRSADFDKTNGNLHLTDNIKLNASYDVYWFMHTKADIEISSDGKNATLTQNGNTITVSCNGDGVFSVMDAVPLNTSPNPDTWPENMANDGSYRAPTNQNKNTGVKKLCIILQAASGDINFDVTFEPLV